MEIDSIKDRTFTTQTIWSGVGLVPEAGKPILYCTNNYKAGTFKTIRDKRDWEWKVEKYSICCWCYQENLLPF